MTKANDNTLFTATKIRDDMLGLMMSQEPKLALIRQAMKYAEKHSIDDKNLWELISVFIIIPFVETLINTRSNEAFTDILLRQDQIKERAIAEILAKQAERLGNE